MTQVETAAAPRSWWQRNWKWILVAGVLLACVLAIAAFVFAIFAFVSGVMRESVPFQHAVAAARADPAVVAALGEPIETGVVVSGRIHTSGAEGSASLTIPLHGPEGAAHVLVVAERVGGTWTYQTLEVQMVARQQAIDLLQ